MEEALKKFISEFEKYLIFNLYKKYQISNQQYVYDIEKTEIISILVRKEKSLMEECVKDNIKFQVIFKGRSYHWNEKILYIYILI